jgi:hypothetical protein
LLVPVIIVNYLDLSISASGSTFTGTAVLATGRWPLASGRWSDPRSQQQVARDQQPRALNPEPCLPRRNLLGEGGNAEPLNPMNETYLSPMPLRRRGEPIVQGNPWTPSHQN